jgi:C_GCAxxG_C_C family probable redox protein
MESQSIGVKASGHFGSGFNCAESVLKSIVEDAFGQCHACIPRAATAFGGGVGGTHEELCGALSGGIMAIGVLLGRTDPGVDVQRVKQIATEFRSRFLARNGSTRCQALLDSFGPQTDSSRCQQLTGETAALLLGLLAEHGVSAQGGEGCAS